MQIDHIFIFSTNQGQEADELVNFGLVEGSSRVHPGQGTTNRKFYFENFFLEILWVHDQQEAQSPQTAITHLWERSLHYENSYSPFGLCLVNTPETDAVFVNSQVYQPQYFPAGMSVDFIHDSNAPQMPWLFRLPFTGPKKAYEEPTDHQIVLRNLTKAVFTVSGPGKFTKKLTSEQISFQEADSPLLMLEFDKGAVGKQHHFKHLPLVVSY